MVLVSALVIICIILCSITLYYFKKKATGKGYAAAGAVAGIVTVFAVYASIVKIGVPAVLIALILRTSPEQASSLIAPNIIVIVISAGLALYICRAIYRLAISQIRSDILPTNASAMDYYDGGIDPGVVALALAHWRFVLARKPDLPINRPGESPYGLPDIGKAVDWANLSADLLVQIEPSLDRESFHYVEGRNFYVLLQNSPFDDEPSVTWFIYAAPDGIEDRALEASFINALPERLPDSGPTKLIICVQSAEIRDEVIATLRGMPLRLITEGMLVTGGLDFTAYASSLVRRFSRRFVPGTEYSLEDSFVRPRMIRATHQSDPIAGEADEGEMDLLDYLDQWAVRDGLSHISIIGEFGQGKSTALLAFCASWARRWASGERGGRIPLLIELRGKSPKRQSAEAFLAEWGLRYRLNGEALYNLVRSGQALLIFEGFDEIQDAGMRFERFQQFKALWALSHPGNRIIFTGRPNFFLDTREMRQLLRDSVAARDAGVDASEIFSLTFMDAPAIAQALRRVPAGVRDEIMAHCSADAAFYEIARRPSMLPVIATQWASIRSSVVSRKGITSAAIIRSFIEFLYARKEADRDELGEYQTLHREVRHYFTQRIAWRMAANSLRNTIGPGTFAQEISDGFDWLDAEFRQDADADASIATTIAVLKARFQGRPKAELLAAIAHDVRTYGLLVPDPAGGPGNLYFPHKQYYEFVIGESFWLRENLERAMWLKQLSSAAVARILLSEPISLLFAAGLWDADRLMKPVGATKLSRASDLVTGINATISAFSHGIFSWPAGMWGRIRKRSKPLAAYTSKQFSYREIMEMPIGLRGLIMWSLPHSESVDAVRINFIARSFSPIILISFIVIISQMWSFVWESPGSLFADIRLFRIAGVTYGILITYLIVTFVMMRRAWGLRACGLVMELNRFGKIYSVRGLRHAGLQTLVVALSRATGYEIFRPQATNPPQAPGPSP